MSDPVTRASATLLPHRPSQQRCIGSGLADMRLRARQAKLERVKGSNACRDSKNKDKNINPFPTKQFLEFDFLTGETLPKK